MHQLYPAFLNLNGRRCLVIGGGNLAERKAGSLLECGARVLVVSPELTPILRSQAESGLIAYRQGSYRPEDLQDAFLVIGATDREEVNRRVADDCAAKNILCNIVDDPPKCNFFVPATVRRGALTLAVSTAGKSPLMARKIKEELEQQYGQQYAVFLELLGKLRLKVISSIADEPTKKEVLQRLISDEIVELLKKDRMDSIKERWLRVFDGSGLEP